MRIKLEELESRSRPRTRRRSGRVCGWPSPVRGWWLLLACLWVLIVPRLRGQTNALPPLLPPYGELPPTFWEQHGTFGILCASAAIALAGLGLWWSRRPRPKIILPPAVRTRQALDSLRRQPEDGAGLSRISQILRHYFMEAFELAPGELTTAEFNRALASCERVDAELAQAIADFLRDCDGRKFSPEPAWAPLDALNRAWELVARAEQGRTQYRPSAESPFPTRRL